MERIVVDPITRIEGHLRIEADVQNGVIVDALSSGSGFRGLEAVVENRDPRDIWAFVQRVCGVCTTTHALASVRTVENALGIEIPKNANLIRNIMGAAQMMSDHLVHFYILHALDWVDVVSGLKADPAETSRIAQAISKWPKSSVGYFTDVQNKIKALVESGQLGIFANGYWGHPSYKLPPEINLLATAHYLEALDFQREMVKVQTILGGKNPHPFYVVGGMATPLDPNNDNSINIHRLMQIERIIADGKTFIEQVYIPDLKAIGAAYAPTTNYGGGIENYLVMGSNPTKSINDVSSYRYPRGIIVDGDINNVITDFDLTEKGEIAEFIDKSWYSYDGNKRTGGKHPLQGETTPAYDGPAIPFKNLTVDQKYSWIKAPRWQNKPMEVGPLARMLVGYGLKKPEYVNIVDTTLAELGVGVGFLNSVLGRTVARGLETVLAAGWGVQDMKDLIANVKSGDLVTFNNTKWDPSTWPKNAKGIGYMEGARGTLSHFIEIENGKSKKYQMIVPTTWNASPRNDDGVKAPYEAALTGAPMVDIEQPLEILRVIHSFDPCIACAIHVADTKNNKQIDIKIG
jgi:hydrogenase large subunit